ncbi:hypothetical protein A20C1_08768 [marine actinobacterium PHSC20C1]|nr:hypothetical protein A20C1_08768 [marine actinobacterium PHSC20C1]
MDVNAARSAELEQADDVVSQVRALQERGLAQARAGDRESLNTIEELTALAVHIQSPWFGAIASETKARALAILGDVDTAIITAKRAACAYRSANDPQSAATTDRLAAQLLATQGRFKAAAKILRTVVRNARDDRRTLRAAALELADCLDSLGQKRGAAAARARAGNAQP